MRSQRSFFAGHLDNAEGGARFDDLGGEGVRRHLELVSHQAGTQIATLAESLLNLLRGFGTGGQIVKLEGDLGLLALDQFDEGGDGFAALVFLGGGAGEEDLRQRGRPLLQKSLALLLAEFVGSQFGRLLGHADLVLTGRLHVGKFNGILGILDLGLFAGEPGGLLSGAGATSPLIMGRGGIDGGR